MAANSAINRAVPLRRRLGFALLVPSGTVGAGDLHRTAAENA
jgi:hypothetical protein